MSLPVSNLAAVLDAVNDALLLFDEQATLQHVNRAARHLLGAQQAKRLADLQPVLGADAAAWLLSACTATAGDGPAMERRIVDPEGRERWLRLSGQTLADEAGAPMYLAALQDCGAERQARLLVDRSVNELEQWFGLSPVGMVMLDADGLIVRSNPAFEALLGTVPITLADADPALRELLGWGDSGLALALMPGAAAVERQVRMHQPDGKARRLRARMRAIDPSPGQRRIIAMIDDRSAEDEREVTQLEIGALMDTAQVGVATFEMAGGWLDGLSTRGRKPAARAAATGLQAISRDLVDAASRPDYERLQRALKSGERIEVRYAVRHPELGLRWLLTRVEPGQLASGRRASSVVTLDVTEQEIAQRRNEQLLRELSTILDGTSAGIAYLRGSVLVRCNQRFERMLGQSGGKVAGATLEELFGRQGLAGPVLRECLEALRRDGVAEAEFAVPRQPGVWYALSVRHAAGSAGDGDRVRESEAVAVLSDISRLKSQQAELENLLRERELMFNLSGVGIAYLRGGRIERVNSALCTLTGHSAQELLQLEHADLFEDRSAWLAQREAEAGALREHARYATERWLRRRDGSLLWVQASKRLVDEAEPGAGMIVSYVDVDERQRAREQLVHQAESTRAILDSVLVGIVTVGEGGIEWMNRSARRMFGGELEDFVGRPISAVATPEPDHPLRRTHYVHALADGQAEAFECCLQARDGRAFWVVGNAVVTGRESGRLQLTFALLDIESRRVAELRIAQAQESLQRIIDVAPMAISLHDAQSLRLLRLNPMAASFIGRPLAGAVGLPLDELFGAADAAAFESDMQQALATQQVTRREYVRTGAQGLGERVWDARYLPLAGQADESPEQLLLVAADVTEQRQAETARFDAAIAQRDMLVKEVHHRIKNNLQGVAGLMQQVARRRPEVASVIAEAIGQVQAIAQVYGLQVGVSGPLRVKSVIEAIAGSVQRTFGRTITVEVWGGDAQRWVLPEAESIPIALIVNELLTNAIKHSLEGDVRCSVAFEAAGVQISIRNLGRLPDGFDLARVPGGVSGLGLVRALLPRKHARFTLEQHGADVLAGITLLPPGVALLDAA
jgi:PAS domain S-box-containing protein